jgi:hypothetical protein
MRPLIQIDLPAAVQWLSSRWLRVLNFRAGRADFRRTGTPARRSDAPRVPVLHLVRATPGCVSSVALKRTILVQPYKLNPKNVAARQARKDRAHEFGKATGIFGKNRLLRRQKHHGCSSTLLTSYIELLQNVPNRAVTQDEGDVSWQKGTNQQRRAKHWLPLT